MHIRTPSLAARALRAGEIVRTFDAGPHRETALRTTSDSCRDDGVAALDGLRYVMFDSPFLRGVWIPTNDGYRMIPFVTREPVVELP
jgi:hypothetical protein